MSSSTQFREKSICVFLGIFVSPVLYHLSLEEVISQSIYGVTSGVTSCDTANNLIYLHVAP